ncbi:MAG: CHAT domain-containing protein [Chloroflexota bacterium]
MNYLDFTLRARDWAMIDRQTSEFQIEVLESPAGEMRTAETVQYNERTLMQPLLRLQEKLIDSDRLRTLGQSLADILLPERVRELLLSSLNALDEDEGLRLRLQLNHPELANLPWEYLYLNRMGIPESLESSSSLDGFLALDPRVSIVRHEALPKARQSIEVTPPLKFVAGFAEPLDLDPLNLANERRLLERALTDSEDVSNKIKPTYIDHLTIPKLEQSITGAHIFHFAGHGVFFTNDTASDRESSTVAGQGAIVLENESGEATPFFGDKLARLLSQTRLVVMGACESGRRDDVNVWSGVAPALMLAGIPAVVAMQYQIYDESALAFARRFYQCIALGQSIDEAMVQGRLAILNLEVVPGDPTELDFGVPVLYMRSEDGLLFPEVNRVVDDTLKNERLRRFTENLVENLAEQITPEPVTPPSWDTMIRYLNIVSQPDSPPEYASEGLKTLWSIPFYAKVEEGMIEHRHELFKAATIMLNRNRRINGAQRVTLLAESGSGKTPALRYLMNRVAQRTLRHIERSHESDKEFSWLLATIPIFLQISDLGTGLSLPILVRDAINRHLLQDPEAEALTVEETNLLLSEYRCMLLFDGLDQLGRTSTNLSHSNESSSISINSLQTIRRFMELHPYQQHVVSCSTVNYHNQLGTSDIIYLDHLNEEEARSVLGDTYYRVLSTGLRELARNRSMLEIILELEYTPPGAELQGVAGDPSISTPALKNKGQLLRHLNRRRLGLEGDLGYLPPNDLPAELLEGLLEELAFYMQRNHVDSCSEQLAMEVTRTYLTAWDSPYNWRSLIHALRDLGFIRRDAYREWHFQSQTTRSYYAGEYLAANPSDIAIVLQELDSLWWRGTLEVLIGLTLDPDELMLNLIDRDVFVAAHCKQFLGEVYNQQVEDAMVDAMIEQLPKETPENREKIVEMLGQTGHPRAAESLLRLLHREWASRVVIAIARSIWVWSMKNPDVSLEETEREVVNATRNNPKIVAQLMGIYRKAIQKDGQARAPYRQLLINRMNDPAQFELARGLCAVGLGFIADDDAVNALLEVFYDADVDDFVAWCATDALVQLPQKRNIESYAVQLYTNAEYQSKAWAHHRSRAVYLMGRVCTRPETSRELLKALNDFNYLVRGYAVQSVALLDLREARELLENMLDKEHDHWTLRRIAKGLGMIGTIDSIPVLERHLRNDTIRIRWMVRSAIKEIRNRYEL